MNFRSDKNGSDKSQQPTVSPTKSVTTEPIPTKSVRDSEGGKHIGGRGVNPKK